MNRRESFKTIILGMVSGATVGSVTTSCQPDTNTTTETGATEELGLYGRTPREIAHDQKILSEVFLNEHELETIAILCDIILPATPTAGSATEAGVPEFIDFIVKDMPQHQLPMRGGLMWLDTEARRRFDQAFKACGAKQQMAIVDDIAYPDPDGEKPNMAHGIEFFNLMRNLTLTGYYTSKIGIEDLGYIGNFANTWDGVPPEVLAKHDVDYDPEWVAKCVDQEKRNVKAEWDDEGNLIT